ncbi:MAG: hypothetical protein ABUS57_07360 [Pseudomonadota bacterium]
MMKQIVGAALAVCFAIGAAASAETPADATMSVADYVRRGMPSVDQVWGPTDYETAASVFATLAPTQLPRTESTQSSAVIDRIVDMHALDPCSDARVSIQNRYAACGD